MSIKQCRWVLSVLFSFAFFIEQGHAQPGVSRVLVSDSLLRKHVFTLSSDSLQGRATGTIGQLQAAFYCIRSFRQSHLLPVFRVDSIHATFRQKFAFTVTEVAPFGNMRTYGSQSSTYKKHELALLPLTGKDSNQVLFGDNVAGLLVGTDLKQEIIVLSAHYDHLGKLGKRIFHGADDNASGTAAILSIASVFDSLAQQGIRPRRSMLFVLFSGEEDGLLGSDYFIRNSPIPLQQMRCNLNVDMVGRTDYPHRKKSDYCYIITGPQPPGLLQQVEMANKQSVNVALNNEGYDVKTDPSQHFYRSDHYNFFKSGVPVLFFTSGEHPDYHQPSDTADKINYLVLQKRATLIFQTAWRIANPPL
ncbi:M28 family metallopeptidase [Spirosoma sp. KNUC1025]|uniref:M28 family metallopeptidase n=1 Tax=Spirosoma sp. KNUC1025 TaxID=2894082 RepID=UPI0038702C44|nr:M28 family peptidase [Spirosoma sp. KNUC1025]